MDKSKSKVRDTNLVQEVFAQYPKSAYYNRILIALDTLFLTVCVALTIYAAISHNLILFGNVATWLLLLSFPLGAVSFIFGFIARSGSHTKYAWGEVLGIIVFCSPLINLITALLLG